MLDSCETWQEYLCLTTAIYLGARRRALARVRRRDVDMENGMIRFVEKGPKVIDKPLPNEYAQILAAAQEAGIWKTNDDYLIPNRRPLLLGPVLARTSMHSALRSLSSSMRRTPLRCCP